MGLSRRTKEHGKESGENADKPTNIVSLEDIELTIEYCEPSGFGGYVASLNKVLQPNFPNLIIHGVKVPARGPLTAAFFALRLVSFFALVSFWFPHEFSSIPIVGEYVYNYPVVIGTAVVSTVLSYVADSYRRTKCFEIYSESGELLYSRRKEGDFPFKEEMVDLLKIYLRKRRKGMQAVEHAGPGVAADAIEEAIKFQRNIKLKAS